MRIKRFVAAEMREAIRTVRETFGPDAVILSNRKVTDGVEVVAAVDYDDNWARAQGESVDTRDVVANGTELQRPAAAPSTPSATARISVEMGPEERLIEEHQRHTRVETEWIEDSDPTVDALDRPRQAVDAPSVHSNRTPSSRSPRSSEQMLSGALEQELRSLRGLLQQQVSTLAWGDFGRRHPERAAIVRRLMQMGLTRAVADPIAANAHSRGQGVGEAELLWQRALADLVQRVPVSCDDVLASGGVIALLGPTGVGKTTTIAKLAARFRMRHGAGSAALLTTDNYRVGAQEQLRTYGQLMSLPVAVCGHANEVHDAIARYRDRRLILIDTAGMSQRDIRLAEQAALIQQGADDSHRPLAFHLVLSATANHSTLDETVRAFADIPLSGCVVTKVDEATSLGGTLSVLAEHALPLAFLCDGQRVPEDLAVADAEQFVSRAVQFARRAAERGDESLEMAYGGVAAHA